MLYSTTAVAPELIKPAKVQSHVAQSAATIATLEQPLVDENTHKLGVIKGTKRSIGGVHHYENRPFVNHEIVLPKDTVLYLTTDGYADQHNPKREKYSRQKLYKLMGTIANMPLEQQKQALNNELQQHMTADTSQRDDITIVGLKL